MSKHWLYQQRRAIDPKWNPRRAARSTYNWPKALRLEIEREHGVEPGAQFTACENSFQRVSQTTSLAEAELFEPLYASLIFALSCRGAAQRLRGYVPAQPSAIVDFYYSVYNATRAMFAAQGQRVQSTHSAALKAFLGNLRPRLPHPFDMVASRDAGENYGCCLPSYPAATSFDLQKSLDGDRERARGMLLGYLSGTAAYYADEAKERIRAEGKYQVFRTQEAKAVRDKRLLAEIGFLHCADAVYLTYGSTVPPESAEFIEDLAIVSRFYFLCAVAFTKRRVGAELIQEFSADLARNVRSLDKDDPQMYFWEGVF